MPPLLECVAISKRFGATQALREVSLSVAAGEVVALVGENGAGKSTLVRIISGELTADSGEIRVQGTPLGTATPSAAARAGVAVVHQELSYVPTTPVAENLLLARLPRRRGARFLVDRKRLLAEARELLAPIAPGIDVRATMGDLRMGDRQLVEIARATSSGASLVLMDEPTAALNATEVATLFEAVAVLRGQGVGVLYISHRLDEIQRVADRVVVLRDGRRVGAHAAGEFSREQLVEEIVGRQLGEHLRASPPEPDATGATPCLQVSDLTVPGRLQPLSLTVHPGEILGLYGLAGSGVEVIAKAIVGAAGSTGQVTVGERRLTRRTPATCRKVGLAHVPSDRRAEGIFPMLPLGTNIALTTMAARGAASVATRSLDRGAGRHWAAQLDIRPPDPDLPVGNLSGGNQQKSIFGRWLAVRPRVFVLDEPTKGVDVGARSQMYDLITDVAASGAGVVVISSELPELMSVCTRIGVVTRGRLVGTYATTAVDEQRIVDLAIGGHP